MITRHIQLCPIGNLIMRATNIVRRFLSIHNYMKTYEASMVTRKHGRIRVDEHANLKDSKKLIAKLEKEETNLYNKVADKWKTYTDQYYDVVKKRQDPRLTSPAEVYDQYEYFTKISWFNERQYTKLYRRKLGTAEEELVLDIMDIPQLKRYFKTVELVRTCFNDSQTIIGFGCDLHNNQKIKWLFKDLKTGKIIQQYFEESVKNVVFYDDNSIMFVVEDANKRPYKVYHKKIGHNESNLLYEQKDEEYYLDLHTSKDKKQVFIVCATKVNTEVLSINKNQKGQLKINKTFGRQLKSRAFANSSNSQTYIWTDIDNSYDYKVVKVNSKTGIRQDFYVPEQGLVIYEVDLFKDFMVLYMRKISKSIVRIIMLDTKVSWDLEFPEQVFSAQPGANEGYSMRDFVFFVNTPFKYNIGYKYNIDKKQLTQLSNQKLTGPAFSEDKYKAHLVHAESQTGDLIPVTILENKNRKGPAKLLLHVYGCYGLQNEIHYNNVYMRALEMGWVIAFAHVRGGGQKGRNWWKQGILQNKSRAWKDLNECVAYLLKQEYTHPSLLVLHGGSAGAITVWNAINHAPWLYKAAVMVYPFLDVLTSLLDQSLPLTISDHAQFGNPNQSIKAYNTIESYCPYQTIKTQQYPAIYIQAGTNDYRCPLYQVLKFSQRFRTRAKPPTKYLEYGGKGLLVDIQKDSSHHGIADAQQSLRKNCEVFGFLDYLLTEINKQVTYS